MNYLILLLILILIVIYLMDRKNNRENFTNCAIYGNDYDTCYANPECTIGFAPNGMTTCMKKFIHENI